MTLFKLLAEMQKEISKNHKQPGAPAATVGVVHANTAHFFPAAVNFSLCTSGMDSSQCLFEMKKHFLIIQLGRQDTGKAHFPRLPWGLSWWGWEMHVLAAATPVKQTALGLPHSAEQGGSDFCPCTELPAVR